MTGPAAAIASGLVQESIPLGPLTTYKSGGPARFYSKPSGPDEMESIVEFASEAGVPILIIGRGSNLLVADSGFNGLVVHMAQGFSDIVYDGLLVTAGAGAPLPVVARGSVSQGIAGLEFFVGVPGSVGGAVRQNAGCFGVETKDRMIKAKIIDLLSGYRFERTAEELAMGYRHTSVESHWAVLSAVFQGASSDTSESSDELKMITRWRKANQPGGTLNAGSVFKNPPETSAGFIIERAGLKGFTIGEVSVSEKHANFFVATPAATSEDIRDLILSVKSLVAERSGIELEPEIQMVGFDDVD